MDWFKGTFSSVVQKINPYKKQTPSFTFKNRVIFDANDIIALVVVTSFIYYINMSIYKLIAYKFMFSDEGPQFQMLVGYSDLLLGQYNYIPNFFVTSFTVYISFTLTAIFELSYPFFHSIIYTRSKPSTYNKKLLILVLILIIIASFFFFNNFPYIILIIILLICLYLVLISPNYVISFTLINSFVLTSITLYFLIAPSGNGKDINKDDSPQNTINYYSLIDTNGTFEKLHILTKYTGGIIAKNMNNKTVIIPSHTINRIEFIEENQNSTVATTNATHEEN